MSELSVAKSVLVEIVENAAADNDTDSYQVTFQSSSCQNSKADLHMVVEKLHLKSPSLSSLLTKSELQFKQESTIIPGKWVVLSEASPLKNGVSLKCVVRPKNLMLSDQGTTTQFLACMLIKVY